MWDNATIMMLVEGTFVTLYMTLLSTFMGYVLGLPMGIALVITAPKGLRPNKIIYKILDVIVNIVRSIPFLILLILVIPLTRIIVGQSYGPTATIVPLTLAAAPFIARMVESSLLEVDPGVIEAAQSMGANIWTIIWKVMLAESRTSLLVNGTIALGTILGYSAMAGAVGGGGLGDIAIRYGYYRYQTDIMLVTVVLLVLLVQLLQYIGMTISKKLDNKVNVINERFRRRNVMKKKVIAWIAVAALSVSALTGCGSKGTDDKTIKVAATAVPHAEILEQAKPLLAEQGYTLEVQVFDDYVQPNEVVESGEFDANYFQHIPYLESFNEEKGTHLVNAGGIHYEPFGLYPGTETSLDNIDNATIAVPNDTTNEARALLLLQDNGYITLKDGVGLTATTKDIVENPHNITFVELEAAQVPRTLPEVSFGVLNGNYAMEAGLTVADDALLFESADSEAAATYVNVIAVKEGNENLPKIKALVDTLKSDEIKQFINDNYNGGVIPYK